MTNVPPYMNKKTLAVALDCSESMVDELVRTGVIPKPAKWSAGCARWRWSDVDAALQLYGGGTADDNQSGVRNARKASEGRRDAS